jgi:hypothetical protein
MRSYFLYFILFIFPSALHIFVGIIYLSWLPYIVVIPLSSLHKLRRKITILVGYSRETTQTSHHHAANEFEEKSEIKNRKFYFENKTKIITEREKSHIQANRSTHGM